jgi:hypothetical protein
MFLQLFIVFMVIGLLGGIIWRVVEEILEHRAWAKKVQAEQDQELYYSHDCKVDDE